MDILIFHNKIFQIHPSQWCPSWTQFNIQLLIQYGFHVLYFGSDNYFFSLKMKELDYRCWHNAESITTTICSRNRPNWTCWNLHWWRSFNFWFKDFSSSLLLKKSLCSNIYCVIDKPPIAKFCSWRLLKLFSKFQVSVHNATLHF